MKNIKITKNTPINSLLEKHPEAAEILMAYGLHCVGCHFSELDTIGDASVMHGMSDKEIEMMIKDVNKIAGRKIAVNDKIFKK